MRCVLRAVLLLPILCAAAASADEPSIEVTPTAGFRLGGGFEDAFGGSTSKLDQSTAFGAIVSYRLEQSRYLELVYSHQDTSVPSPVWTGAGPIDLKVEYLSFGGLYEFSTDSLRPFLGATLGVTRFSSSDAEVGSDVRVAFGISGGVKQRVTRNVGLRLEARLWLTFTESGGAALCQGGSCVLVFSSSGFGQAEVLGGVTIAF